MINGGFYYYVLLYHEQFYDTIYKNRHIVYFAPQKGFHSFMKFSLPELPRTPRSRTTRICIGQAVIDLMKQKPFNEIRVTDIVSQAGVSRMTYYKYYTSKIDVLKDFLQEIILAYDMEQKENYPNALFQKNQIFHSICFFERYAPLLEVLAVNGQYELLMQSILQYTKDRIITNPTMGDYKIYYYTGAVIGVFIRWLEKGKPESPEELTETIWKIINTT